MVIGDSGCLSSEPMSSTGRSGEEVNDDQQFHVIQTKANLVDPASERVFCPYCHAFMKFLPGFPLGHAQWLCTSCAEVAYEGYGDRPSYDTDYKSLSSPNNPYQDTNSTAKMIIRDIPSDLDDGEDEEHHGQWGRIDVTTADKKRRYGIMFGYLTAQEATKKI